MGLLTKLLGGNETASNETETEEPTYYLFTWTEMCEVDKTTATIQFVSGKQKRVSYTNRPHNQVFEDETTDSEPVEVNWDNIEYVDTESTETVEIPVEKSRFATEDTWDIYRSLAEEESVVTETIDWEEY